MAIDRDLYVIGGPCEKSKDGHIIGAYGCCAYCAIALSDVDEEDFIDRDEFRQRIEGQDPVDLDPEEEYWDVQPWERGWID